MVFGAKLVYVRLAQKIEHISGSCPRILLRVSHPEATCGILVWSKAHVWENSVEKVLGVSVKKHSAKILKKHEKC